MRSLLPNSSDLPLFLTLMLLGGCGGGDGIILPIDGEPAGITVVDGNEQKGRVREPLTKPLVVQVTDSRGRPVQGATVAFELTSAGSEVVPNEKTTDADGKAGARLVLGTTVGRQTGKARVVAQEGKAPVQADFSAIALSENASSMAAVAGQDQTGHVGQPLDDRLVVEVTDGFGNPVAGMPISWAAVGGGTVSESIVETDEDGRSRVERTLGPAVGQQSTVASSEGLAGSPVTFVHTALAGDASRLIIVSGNDQTAEAGTVLPEEPAVRLVDSDGNGVPSTAVTWLAATGGGSVAPENTTTDADGRTSARWTLGQTLGDQRLDAVVSGVGVASFHATATSGAPASLFIRTQPSGTARNGEPFGRQPVIQLRDGHGNDVATAGVQITVELGGGGELEGTTRRSTDASGRAAFDDLAISGAPGPRTLAFTASGYAQVTSDEIDLQAIGTSTTITADSPDPSGVGATVTVQFQVSSQGPTPVGSVTVSDGVQSCSGALSSGAGSCQLALTTVGQRMLTATYPGGPGLLGSSDAEGHTVTAAPPPPPASTVTTITDDTPDPSISGTSFTVRFTVTASGATPTGSVRVTVSGGTANCTGQLSGGAGSCELALITVGDRTLTATYSGGPGFTGSLDTEAHRVDARPPDNEPPSADFNWHCEGLTCNFTDRSDDDDGTIASRRWDFGDGSPASDEVNPSHPYAAAGEYRVTLVVTDNGGLTDESHDDVDPEAPPPAGTTTTITSDDPEPSEQGAGITVSFTVTSTSGTPDGIVEVTWADGGSCSATVALGSCTLTPVGVGAGTITATYQGSPSFTGSSDTEPHTINPPPPANTETTITDDTPDPTNPGESFTVSFTVTSPSGTPAGTVTVSDGVDSCSGDLTDGSGTCPLVLTTSGTRTLTATYAGNPSFSGSTSAPVDHEVTPPTTPPPGD